MELLFTSQVAASPGVALAAVDLDAVALVQLLEFPSSHLALVVAKLRVELLSVTPLTQELSILTKLTPAWIKKNPLLPQLAPQEFCTIQTQELSGCCWKPTNVTACPPSNASTLLLASLYALITACVYTPVGLVEN